MALSYNTNFFKFIQNYLSKNRTVSHLPIEVSIELTNVCNFSCIFCPQSDGNHLDRLGRNFLSVNEADYMLQKLRSFGYKRKLIHWTLDGEPFVNRRFKDIFIKAKQYGFTVQHFATNGYFLDDKTLNELPNDVKFIFSIDFCSNKEYFEYTRGTQGSWQVIKENIYNILSKKYSNVELIINDISEFGDFTNKEIISMHDEMKRMFPDTTQVSYSFRSFHNATGFLEENFKKQPQKYHLCPYPWSSMFISSNGDVVACCRDLEHKSVMGNIFQEYSFNNIWNGESMISFRDNLILKYVQANAACKSCDLPWDKDKFSLSNISKTIFKRLEYRVFR